MNPDHLKHLPRELVNEHDSLLRTILANPQDDAPRLVYADWLEEHSSGESGHPLYDRADFIRSQMRLFNLQAADGDEAHADQLLDRYRAEWTTHLPFADPVFERGFVAGVASNAAQFLQHAATALAHHPITSLNVTDHGYLEGPDRSVTKLLYSTHMSHITCLDLTGCPLNPPRGPERSPLAASKSLANLQELDLTGIDRSHFPDVAAARNMPALLSLDLTQMSLEDYVVEALAHKRNFPKLQRLNLTDNEIDNEGAEALASSTRLKTLRFLDLTANPRIGESGHRAIYESTTLHPAAKASALRSLGQQALAEVVERSAGRPGKRGGRE